jgi:hypothetical protein
MHATLYLLPALFLGISVGAPLANGIYCLFLSARPVLSFGFACKSHTDMIIGFPNIRDRAARALAVEADADDVVSNTWDRRSIPVTSVKDADDSVSNTWDRKSVIPNADADDAVNNTWDRRSGTQRDNTLTC